MTTLLALFRRPDGGVEALAEFERRYATEHLPLVAATPGLRSTRVRRVVEALGAETDLVLVTTMEFDDRAAHGRRARLGRHARGRAEPADDRPRPVHAARARGRAGTGRGGFPGRGYCQHAERRSRVTHPPAAISAATPVVVAFPAPAPASAAPLERLEGVALVTIDRREVLNALSASTSSTRWPTRSMCSTPTRPAAPSS